MQLQAFKLSLSPQLGKAQMHAKTCWLRLQGFVGSTKQHALLLQQSAAEPLPQWTFRPRLGRLSVYTASGISHASIHNP